MKHIRNWQRLLSISLFALLLGLTPLLITEAATTNAVGGSAPQANEGGNLDTPSGNANNSFYLPGEDEIPEGSGRQAVNISDSGVNNLDGDDDFLSIITDQDWKTLSQADIDKKLKAAGKKPIGDPKDPLYNFTPEQMGKLTEADWKKIDAQYEKLYKSKESYADDDVDYENLEGTITAKDWETLSQADIDKKLKAAGKESIGDPKDPLYSLSTEQIGKLTEADWKKIDQQLIKLYGNQ